MKRRQVLGLLAAGIALAGGAAVFVLSRPMHRAKHLSITVISAAGDPRIPIVEEAVEHWNRTFAELGTPFRLGSVSCVVGLVPDADVLYQSEVARFFPLSAAEQARLLQLYPADWTER